jgi:hypothetical protein
MNTLISDPDRSFFSRNARFAITHRIVLEGSFRMYVHPGLGNIAAQKVFVKH